MIAKTIIEESMENDECIDSLIQSNIDKTTMTLLEEDQDQKINNSMNSIKQVIQSKISSKKDKTIIEDDHHGEINNSINSLGLLNNKRIISDDNDEANVRNDHMIGKQIRDLEIVSIIGQGGMGKVYLARHKAINKRFAVKCLNSELTQKPDFHKRFHQEAKIQALLEHPNIIQITDFIEDYGQFFIVMEYVEGESLDVLIESRKTLTDDEAIPIIIDVLKGLAHAHSKGVIHRDIKPSNIIITKDGTAKIMDFGIALMNGQSQKNQTAGTVQYMSPEQICRPNEVNYQSDIYSSGIVLFQMLTGKVPFQGEVDVIKKSHIHKKPPHPNDNGAKIFEELSQIVLKTLRKNQTERYHSSDQLLQEIELFQKKTHMECPHSKCNKTINRVENKYKLKKERCIKCSKKLKKTYTGLIVSISMISLLLLIGVLIVHQFKISDVLISDSVKEALLMINQIKKHQALTEAMEKAKRIRMSRLMDKISKQLKDVSANIEDSDRRYKLILEQLCELSDSIVKYAFGKTHKNRNILNIIERHYDQFRSNQIKSTDFFQKEYLENVQDKVL
ncbi:serine/threonine-specific protein kinase [Candidatus Magnetomorum sp. HK-1]|nr:serine/threonine-specific protein kinase [Candidatus Magnetomorum sp. HK-1]